MEKPHRTLRGGEKKAIDDFADRYMKSNPGKSPIEARQEYNREIANNSRSPGGSSRRIPIHRPYRVGGVCNNPITADEFNLYVAEKLKSEDDFDFSIIVGFMYVDTDAGILETPNDKRNAQILTFNVQYNKNNAIVSCNQILLVLDEEEYKLEYDAYDELTIREFLNLETQNFESEGVTEYLVRKNQVRPLISFILTNLISINEETDLYLDYNSVLDIIERRKTCRRIDIDTEKIALEVFKRDGVVDNIYANYGIDTKEINKIKRDYLKYP